MLENIINGLIVAFPQLVVILTTLISSKKKIDNFTNEFPEKFKDFKETTKEGYEQFKDKTEKMVSNKIGEMQEKVNNLVEDIAEKTVGELTRMNQVIQSYAKKIEGLLEAQNNLVKENDTYQKLLSIVVSNDPNFIKNGVSDMVKKELKISKEKLAKIPQEIQFYLPQIKEDLIFTLKVLGKEGLENILKEVGYERKENKEL